MRQIYTVQLKNGEVRDMKIRHTDLKIKHESIEGDNACLSQGFYYCTNIMIKKQVGGERVYLTYSSKLLFIIKADQDWN